MQTGARPARIAASGGRCRRERCGRRWRRQQPLRFFKFPVAAQWAQRLSIASNIAVLSAKASEPFRNNVERLGGPSSQRVRACGQIASWLKTIAIVAAALSQASRGYAPLVP